MKQAILWLAVLGLWAGILFLSPGSAEKPVKPPEIPLGETLSSLEKELPWPSEARSSQWAQTFPLSRISYRLEEWLWGRWEKGRLVTHFLLFGLNAVLLYLVSSALFSSRGARWVTLALFLCHPLQVDTLFWLGGRGALLGNCAALAAFLCWVRALRGETTRRYCWSLASGVCLAMALEANPAVLLFPLVGIAYSRNVAPPSRRRVPWIIALSALSVALVLGIWTFPGFSGEWISLAGWGYQLLWPWPFLPLAWPLSLGTPARWALSLILIVGLAGVARDGWRKGTLAGPLALWSLLFLVPTPALSGQEIAFAAPGFSLSLAGWSLLLGFAWQRSLEAKPLFSSSTIAWIAKKSKRLPYGVALTLLLALFCLAVLTVGRARAWQDSPSLWQHALRGQSTLAVYHRYLGQCYLQQARVFLEEDRPAALSYATQAVSHLERAQSSPAGSLDPVRYQLPLAHFYCYQALVKSSPEEQALLASSESRESVLRQFHEALAWFSQVPQEGSAVRYLAWLHQRRGDALCAWGQFDKARSDYQKAVELSDGQPWAWLGLLRCLGLAQRWPEVLQRSQELGQRFPRDIPLQIEQTRALLVLQAPQQAIQTLTRILEMAPDHPDALYYKAETQKALGRLEAMDDELTRLTVVSPRDLRGWYAKARLAEGRFEWDIAERHYQKLLQLRPWSRLIRGEVSRFYLRHGVFLAQKKLDSLSWADYLKASEIDPTNADAYFEQAMILKRRGETAEEISLLETALRHAPHSPRLWLELGHACLLLSTKTTQHLWADKALAAFTRHLQEARGLDLSDFAILYVGQQWLEQALSVGRQGNLRESAQRLEQTLQSLEHIVSERQKASDWEIVPLEQKENLQRLQSRGHDWLAKIFFQSHQQLARSHGWPAYLSHEDNYLLRAYQSWQRSLQLLPPSAMQEAQLLKGFLQNVESLGQETLRELYVQGQNAVAQQQWYQALELFSQAARLWPERAAVPLYNAALCQRQLGKLEQTKESLQRSLALDAGVAQGMAHFLLGEMAFQENRRAEAIDHFKTFLPYQPHGAYADLANTYLKALAE